VAILASGPCAAIVANCSGVQSEKNRSYEGLPSAPFTELLFGVCFKGDHSSIKTSIGKKEPSLPDCGLHPVDPAGGHTLVPRTKPCICAAQPQQTALVSAFARGGLCGRLIIATVLTQKGCLNGTPRDMHGNLSLIPVRAHCSDERHNCEKGSSDTHSKCLDT